MGKRAGNWRRRAWVVAGLCAVGMTGRAQAAAPKVDVEMWVQGGAELARVAAGCVRGKLQSEVGAVLGFGGLLLGGDQPIVRDGIVQFPNSPVMRLGGGAMTLGHFELYAGGAGTGRQVRGGMGPLSPINDVVDGKRTGVKLAQEHEDKHVLQSDILGGWYLPAHGLSMLLGLLTSPKGMSLGEAVHSGWAFMERGPQGNPPGAFFGGAGK